MRTGRSKDMMRYRFERVMCVMPSRRIIYQRYAESAGEVRSSSQHGMRPLASRDRYNMDFYYYT